MCLRGLLELRHTWCRNIPIRNGMYLLVHWLETAKMCLNRVPYRTQLGTIVTVQPKNRIEYTSNCTRISYNCHGTSMQWSPYLLMIELAALGSIERVDC